MTRLAPWYVTEHAVNCYVFARHWPDDDQHWERAEAELLDMCSAATFRARDRLGRELWRSPRRSGRGLRWVIDPRAHPGGPLPAVVWVGYAAPPVRYFDPLRGDEDDRVIMAMLQGDSLELERTAAAAWGRPHTEPAAPPVCDHCGKPEAFCVLCPDCEERACTSCGRVNCCCG